jgi:hypothetical protein
LNVGRYRFVGDHADTLASGSPVGPGDFVELTDEESAEPHNKMHIDDGNLIEAAAEEQKSTKSSRGTGVKQDEGEES